MHRNRVNVCNMKKKLFNFVILFFLLTTDVFGVNIIDTLPTADSATVGLMYKKKAKTTLVTGVILSCAGVIAAGVGTGLTLASLAHLFEPGYKDYGSLPEILGYGGLALIAASVPLYIISGKHHRKAKLYLKHQKPIALQPGSAGVRQLTAGIVINF